MHFILTGCDRKCVFPLFFFLIVNNVLYPFAFTQQHRIKQTLARFTSNNVT